MKIKLEGDDLAWDVERVVAVERVTSEAQAARDCRQWYYSADFNERCSSVDYVLGFSGPTRRPSPRTPFGGFNTSNSPRQRDLRAASENRMHRAARIKPVVIDESLVDLESLQLARELGYSGVALKACKGHSGRC